MSIMAVQTDLLLGCALLGRAHGVKVLLDGSAGRMKEEDQGGGGEVEEGCQQGGIKRKRRRERERGV